MLRPELLTNDQRELEAQRIELEWYVNPTPDVQPNPSFSEMIGERVHRRTLWVATTHNPEPHSWPR